LAVLMLAIRDDVNQWPSQGTYLHIIVVSCIHVGDIYFTMYQMSLIKSALYEI
jgi:hypothetical protein